MEPWWHLAEPGGILGEPWWHLGGILVAPWWKLEQPWWNLVDSGGTPGGALVEPRGPLVDPWWNQSGRRCPKSGRVDRICALVLTGAFWLSVSATTDPWAGPH